MGVLADGGVLSSREICRLTGIPSFALWEALRRCWVKGLVLRSDKPVYERERLNKGRAGRPWNVRPFHLYALKPDGIDVVQNNGQTLVAFSESAKDPRAGKGKSKAGTIIKFLETHKDRAFFSKEIVESLKSDGVRSGDVMANLRRHEQKGLVYVRGYRTHDRRSPFKEGFLITWIEQDGNRDKAQSEAVRSVASQGSLTTAGLGVLILRWSLNNPVEFKVLKETVCN